MNARELCAKLDGHWYGGYGTAACPVCQPDGRRDQNALTLTDGDGVLLANCKRLGCAYSDILNTVGFERGDYQAPSPAKLEQRRQQRELQERNRADMALRCWNETQPIQGTIGETYLRGRGISCDLPGETRFHANCWHKSGQSFPAIISAVTGLAKLRAPAVHRIYLRSDGSGKADVDPPKTMLGRTAGGGVVLSRNEGPIVVTEGIETGLSLASGLLGEPATIIAALSTSGMQSLELPDAPKRLIIAPDGDDAGKLAAERLAERAYALGWDIGMMIPPTGKDWNDLITEGRTPS